MTELTKRHYVAGAQCLKLLWWQVHEPLAAELQPDKVLQDLFDQGRQVGDVARTRFPGAVLIPPGDREARVVATQEAITAGATVILEGAFQADGAFVATDILHRDDAGWHLIEVKSASEVKDAHLPDASIQAHVLAGSGITPVTVSVMHLNKEYRHPGIGDLLTIADVTERVAGEGMMVPGRLEEQHAAIAGPLPDVPVGLHCFEPRACPFHDRCWPADDRHISRLYNVGPKRSVAWMQKGVHRIDDLAPDAKLPDTARRQLRALALGDMVVEPSLREALVPLSVAPIGFLDFETVSRAIPVWDGLAPWGMVAAQLSYHEVDAAGTLRHEEFLAEGPSDPRSAIAHTLVDITRDARAVVTYSSFEKTRIRELARTVPECATGLEALEAKLVDLLPVVRNHVYHPAFNGSFSIKAVLHPLVPTLSYDDLIIVNGLVASVEIARLLFVADRIPAGEKARVRQDLLDYCERDTLAMVKLLEALRRLTGPRRVSQGTPGTGG